MSEINSQTQFSCRKEDWLDGLDFLNWYRYYHLIKSVISQEKENILEIGGGSGIVRNCLEPLVSSYTTLDINNNLSPEVVSDVCERVEKLKDQFDCVIAADILEHIPYSTVSSALANLHYYLKKGGSALITIPHRQSNFLWMTPTQIPHVFTVPTGFLSLGAFYRRFIKRKIWIDPCHCWEIGDGNVRVKDVNNLILESGFEVEHFEKLLYVDYWILKKPS